MKKVINSSLLLAGLLAVSSCQEAPKDAKATNADVTSGKGFDLTNLDTSVDPCTDFYQYAVGSWLKNNPVPSTESRWGSFEYLREENNKKIDDIIKEVAAVTDAKKGSDEQLISALYNSYMDEERIEEIGVKAIEADLKRIKNIKNRKDLMDYMMHSRVYGLGSPFSFYVGSDSKDSNSNIVHVGQGGLGMPDRDYYTNTDERSKKIRAEYIDHLEKMFVLLGDSKKEASKNAKTIMEIETQFAENSMTRVEQRDPQATYNKMTVEELKKISSFDWDTYFDGIHVANFNELIVSQPKFMTAFAKIQSKTSLEDWKTYYRWHLVDGTASMMSSDFVNQNFKFFSTVLNGIDEMKPRWKKGINMVNGSLGETLGKIYVKKHFSEDSKERLGNMIENLKVAFSQRIEQLDWMSEETKSQALVKLESFNYKIGYPDNWRDYSSLDLSSETLVQNSMEISKHAYMRMVNELTKPVDKTRWFMNPQTINAYYSPSYNEIVFPAAILQPPFFDASADDAINYGGIGAVIGHEFTHGFDDQGCQYNGQGNLANWWTKEDYSQFGDRSLVVIEQFNDYEPLEGLHVNGELTLGENIADLGGLTLAYYALENSLKGKSSPKEIDGFTYQERFFLGWANVWKNNIKEEALRYRIVNDPHSPGEYRVNGPVSNMVEFQKAFECKASDAMIRTGEKQAKIW